MSSDRTLDSRKFNLSPAAPPNNLLATAEASDDDKAATQSEPELNFFEHMLEIYDEDPERWDGLE